MLTPNELSKFLDSYKKITNLAYEICVKKCIIDKRHFKSLKEIDFLQKNCTSMTFDENYITICWSESWSGEVDEHYEDFPIEWLTDENWEEKYRNKVEAERKIKLEKEQKEKELAKKEKEEQERKLYESLKKKYGDI